MKYGKQTLDLLWGQVVSAVGIVGMVQANIGLDPWNCLHQGLSNVTGLSFGLCTILVGGAAILISALLKEPLGLGTVVNVFCPGLLIDLIQHVHLIPQMNGLWSGIAMILAGQALLVLGTYHYMAASMGAGPRDALMVAVSRPLHIAPGLCRSALEVLAVLLGWRMGAKVGVGTVLSALTIGFFLQGVFFLFRYDPKTVHHASFAELWAALRGWVSSRRARREETAESPEDSADSSTPTHPV